MKKPRLGYITQFAAVSLMFAVISLIIGIIPAKNDKYYLTSAESGEKAPVIVIDPGHGGEDGGASSEDGLLEKDLNLEVSRLCSVLLELGYLSNPTEERQLRQKSYRLKLANATVKAIDKYFQNPKH